MMTLGHFAQSGIEIEKLQKERTKQEAKQKRQQEKEKKKRRRDAKKKNLSLLPSAINSEGDLKLNEGSVFTVTLDKTNQKDVAVNLADSTTNSFNKGQTNLAYQADTNMSDSDSDHSYEDIPEISYHGGEGDACRSGLHSVILDVSTTSFVDTVTVKMLKNIFRDFKAVDLDIYLASCQACVVEQLEKANFFSESVPKSRLFVSVHDAVLHILSKTGQRDFVLAVSCDTQM